MLYTIPFISLSHTCNSEFRIELRIEASWIRFILLCIIYSNYTILPDIRNASPSRKACSSASPIMAVSNFTSDSRCRVERREWNCETIAAALLTGTNRSLSIPLGDL